MFISFSKKCVQVELFEAAKLRNTIACMKSGIGKAFIAVMLIREKALEVCGYVDIINTPVYTRKKFY
jgi:ERCC4-related helicase